MINGIINVNKGAGWTSFDVVARLRSVLGQKKIGHTGTLDPDATGVLPVCLGKATKVVELLTDWDKTYEAVLRLGVVTDTQDMTGTVRESRNVVIEDAGSATRRPEPSGKEKSDFSPSENERGELSLSENVKADFRFSEDEVRAAILSFVGSYDQIPPMFSAKKIDGKRLYELAREGKEVERKPVRVHIRAIEGIEPLGGALIRFTVTCSKGTYIRTLCQDIGEKLGCGGCMESLKRTAVGPFMLKDALDMDEIERLAAGGCFSDEKDRGNVIKGIDSVFTDLPSYNVMQEFMKALGNGNIIPSYGLLPCGDKDTETDTDCDDERIRVYTTEGEFAAIYRRDQEVFRPEKMFV